MAGGEGDESGERLGYVHGTWEMDLEGAASGEVGSNTLPLRPRWM